MDTFWSVIILALVQGVAEFLPISSSGHLVVAGYLVDLPSEEATLEVVLHLGTLLAVLFFFHRRLLALLGELLRGTREGRGWALALVLGTIPAGLAGVLLQDFFQAQFSSLVGTGCWLLVTGLGLFFLGHPSTTAGTSRPPTLRQGLIVGLAQALAILPGISRSGATIVAGMRSGMERRRAGEFSFFLSIPAIAGAGLLKLGDLGRSSFTPTHLVAGTLVSALVGLLCLWLLMWLLARGRLRIFAPWCLAVGTLAVILGLAG